MTGPWKQAGRRRAVVRINKPRIVGTGRQGVTLSKLPLLREISLFDHASQRALDVCPAFPPKRAYSQALQGCPPGGTAAASHSGTG